MRDSMGGVVTLAMIVVFIVLASGYMAFNVNYTKAFRMKNKIISVYEEYDGKCTGSCEQKIKDYAESIGYNVRELNCDKYDSGVTYDTFQNLYCYKEVVAKTAKDAEGNDSTNYVYYKILTKINIDIPVVNRLLNLRALYITGDTKTFAKGIDEK